MKIKFLKMRNYRERKKKQTIYYQIRTNSIIVFIVIIVSYIDQIKSTYQIITISHIHIDNYNLILLYLMLLYSSSYFSTC